MPPSIRASVAERVLANRSARWAGGVVIALCLVAVFAPLLSPYGPAEQLDIIGLRNRPPSFSHPFGTDWFSRDVLSRVLFGARVSLSVAALSAVLATTIGTGYGLLAGFIGGRVDAVMMRVLDGLLSIPRVLLLIAILALWQPVPLVVLILLLGVTGWFGVSRIVRAEVRVIREREYVLAARSLGASHARILARHILPNVVGPIIVAATLGVANVIVLEAGLSYLGIGTREPNASWGTIFLAGSSSMVDSWWVAVFPGLAMLITVLAFNVLGDALRDVFDPRTARDGR